MNIKNENTCFDYIDYEEYDSKGNYAVGVFVEPIGNVYFTAKSKESMYQHLERLFNAQPKEYDYIKAGHVIHYNRTQTFLWSQNIEEIDVEEFWSDRSYKREHDLLEEKTDLEEIRSELNDGKVYLRINEGIEDDYYYRDGLILEVKKVRDLGKGFQLLIALESEKNDEIGIKREENIHDWILKNDYKLKNLDIEFFTENEWEEKKQEILEYKKYEEDMSLQEYLEKKNN